jgi:hypothetical protein
VTLNAPCSACIVPRFFPELPPHTHTNVTLKLSELSLGRPCILGSWRNLAYSQARVRSSPSSRCVLRVGHPPMCSRFSSAPRFHVLCAASATSCSPHRGLLSRSAQAIDLSLPKLVQSRLFSRGSGDRLALIWAFAILLIKLYSTCGQKWLNQRTEWSN